MTTIELGAFAPHEVKVTVKDGMVHVAATHEETNGPGPCISKYVMHRTVAVPPYACEEKVACLMLPNGQLLMYAPPRRDAAPMADEPRTIAGEEASADACSADSENEHQAKEETDKNQVSAGGETMQEAQKVTDAIEEQKIDMSSDCNMEADASKDSSLEIEANDQVEKECCDHDTNESCDGVQSMDGHEHHDQEETCVLRFDGAVDVTCNSSHMDNKDDTSLDTHADCGMSNARGAYDELEETQTVNDDCKDDAREATHEQAERSLESTSQPCQDDTHMVVNEESQHTADDSEEMVLDDLRPTSGNCSTGSDANPYTTQEQKMTELTVAGNDLSRDVQPPATSCEWAATDPTRPIKRAQCGTGTCVAGPGHKDPFIASFPLGNFRPEDISVTVSGNMLVITAEFDNSCQDVTWRESITRKLELPPHLDLSSIKCHYHQDGQLTVTALSNAPSTDL
ncbi:hypothetical protein C0Q70_11175 [Pomacea canaliculata]|uniref:SHSP domain-containing protein n=1 Tax=Pomacea canaliculata TaxID=400727 RepID=A0A2T7P584_POMCA|nr:hypothetical protein C0Q70_11175 [Pomacea canaliculata]